MTQPESFKCPTCKSHLEFQQGDGAGMGRSQYYLLKFVNKGGSSVLIIVDDDGEKREYERLSL